MKKAIADLHKADARMDDIIDDRGLAGGPPPPDGHLKPKGPLPDCSVGVAERELVGWKASTPEQVTAEYFVHGALLTSSSSQSMHDQILEINQKLVLLTLIDWDDAIPPSKVFVLYQLLYTVVILYDK